MKLFNLLFKKRSARPIIIIDIGSASVGGAIVYYQTTIKNGKSNPLITKTIRRPIKLTDNLSLKPFVKSLLATQKEVVAELIKDPSYITPQAVHLFLPSVFIVDQTKVINHQKAGQDFLVDKNLLNRLIKEAKEGFVAKWPGLFSDLIDDRVTVLDNEIMNLKLNGYRTDKVIGRKAQELSLTLFTSLTSETILNKFKEQLIPWAKVKQYYHSFAFSGYEVFQEFSGPDSSFIFLDVTGEFSDLLLIRRGVMLNTASFPLGKNFILKEVAKKLNITWAESYSRLKLYRQGKLEERAYDQVHQAVEEVKGKWLDSFKEALAHLKELYLLPEEILIIGDDLICQLFVDWIIKESLSDFTLSRKNMSARFVRSQLFANRLSSLPPEQMNSQAQDPFLLTNALFCRRRL